MSFLKDLGRGLGIGGDRHAANQKFRGIKKFVAGQEERDKSYIEELSRAAEGAFINPHLQQLLSPAFSSRIAANQQSQVDSAAMGVKGALASSAARSRIGQAQVHRQGFQTDLASASQKAGIRNAHELQRTQLGATVAQQKSQVGADIATVEKGLDDSRERLLSGAQTQRDIDTDRAGAMDMGRGIQMGAMALGGGLGAMGALGGAGGLQGAMGGMQQLGGMAGQMTGGFNPAAIFQGLNGSMMPQGNYGPNPFVTYMMSGILGGQYGMQPQGGARQHDRGLDLPQERGSLT